MTAAVDPARRLVVAYCFTPYVDTSGTVAAKRVHARGEAVDVIQNAMDEITAVDPGLDLITEGLVRRRAVLATPSRFSSWVAIEQWCQAGLTQVEHWVEESRADGSATGDGLPWATMYSRSHFVASHFLAAVIKMRYPAIHWEAEFSDPCSADVTGADRVAHHQDGALLDTLREGLRAAGHDEPGSDNTFEWAEVLPYALADEVVFTNAHQAAFMTSRCRDPRLRGRIGEVARVEHHPQLPPRFYELDRAPVELEPGTTNIAYFGNVYRNRNPMPAVQAVADLPRELRSTLRLHLFTRDPSALDGLVEELGVEDVVRAQPFLPFFQFLELTRRMDLLLLMDAPLPAGAQANPFLLSKWGDYRGSGTPVWGMLEESSVLASLQDPALQLRTPVNHRSAAAQLLSRLLRGEVSTRRVPQESAGV